MDRIKYIVVDENDRYYNSFTSYRAAQNFLETVSRRYPHKTFYIVME